MATEPETVEVPGAGLRLSALAWGPVDGPLALCLHGFPDTAWTWRRLAPELAADGWRVVAPFLRGYAPSDLAPDGRYDLFAYAKDAVAARGAFPGRRAVLIGHDWGAAAAYAVAATSPETFERIATLSIPPLNALTAPPRSPAAALTTIRQLGLSSYMLWNIVPGLAERSIPQLVPALWRRWSPGFDARSDVARVLASLGSPARRTAALRPYRAVLLPWARRGRPLDPARRRPRVPLMALHGRQDGCMSIEFARVGAGQLEPGRFAEITGAGHFMALEQPQAIAHRLRTFFVERV